MEKLTKEEIENLRYYLSLQIERLYQNCKELVADVANDNINYNYYDDSTIWAAFEGFKKDVQQVLVIGEKLGISLKKYQQKIDYIFTHELKAEVEPTLQAANS